MTFHLPFFDTQRLMKADLILCLNSCLVHPVWISFCWGWVQQKTGSFSSQVSPQTFNHVAWGGVSLKDGVRLFFSLAFTWKKSQQDLCSTFFPWLWRSVKLRRHRTLWSFKQLNHTVLSFLCIAKLIRLGVMASLVQAANGSSVSRKPTSISEGIRCLSKKKHILWPTRKFYATLIPKSPWAKA